MNENNTNISELNTNVFLQVIDKDGNVLHEVNDTNSETMWAKINTPVTGTLYLDLITTDVSVMYGFTLTEITKTGSHLLNSVRSNRIPSLSFTLTDNVYLANFSYYNSAEETIQLYGLLSYASTSIYTIFDMSSAPIILPVGATVIGTYQITYESVTPAAPTGVTKTGALAGINRVFTGMQEATPDSIKAYKLSRVFTKTSLYIGSDLTDTAYISNVSVTTTYTEDTSTDFFNKFAGEIVYQCLSSGSPGGALVSRKVLAPKIDTYYGTGVPGYDDPNDKYIQQNVTSNVPYIAEFSKVALKNGVPTGGYADTTLALISANVEAPVTIYPHKVTYLSDTPAVESTLVALSSKVLGYDLAMMDTAENHYYQAYSWMGIPPTAPFYIEQYGGTTATHGATFCQIMYWDSAPTFSIYLRHASIFTMTAYLDGVELAVTTTAVGSHHKFSIDTSALPASGSGVLFLHYTNAGTTFPMHTTSVICSNMYSFVVPYAGMLTHDSSEITSGWVSNSCFNIEGSDVLLTSPMTTPSGVTSLPAMTYIQNTSISEAMQQTRCHYNVSVTLENFNSVVGIIEKDNKGMIQMMQFARAGNAYTPSGEATWSWALPYFVGDSNFVHFGHGERRLSRYIVPSSTELYRAAIHANPAYFEALYNPVCNTALTYNSTTREVVYLDLNGLCYPSVSTALNDIPLLCFKEQGTNNYNKLIPENACTYVPGTPTIEWGGKIYEFESLLQTVEAFGNIQVSINAASVLASNEYVTIPFASDTCIPLDSLEEWNALGAYNINRTVFSDEISKLYINADELVNVYDETVPISRLAANTGELLTCDMLLPSDNVQVEGVEYTHVLSFSISWNTNTLHFPVVHIPKKLIIEGTTLYTNVTSVYVTDGLHVIPWSLHHDWETTPLDVHQNLVYSWELELNRTNLTQLYPSNTSLIVYAYVIAKQKSEWLPLDIDIKTSQDFKYVDNNGKDTLLLIHSDNAHGDLQITNSASMPSSLITLVTSGENVAHSTTQYKFSSSSIHFSNSTGYIKFSTNNTNGMGIPRMHSDMTIDFWIMPTDLTVQRSLFYLGGSPDPYGNTLCELRLSTSGCITFDTEATAYAHYINDPYPFQQTPDNGYGALGDIDGTGYITIDTWHHIALVVVEGYVHIYVDGHRRVFLRSTIFSTSADITFFPNYIGYLAEFHITADAIWHSPFVPPSYAWGTPELEEEGIRYRDTTLIPIELPIALDNAFDIVNAADNSKVTFLHADACNRKVVGDVLSNSIYLVANTCKYTPPDTIRVSYLELPIRSRMSGQYEGGITGVYMGINHAHARDIRTVPSSVLDTKPTRTLSVMRSGDVYSFITDKRYQKLGYSFDSTIHITDKTCTTVQIIEAEVSNSSEPEDIFHAYLTPQGMIDTVTAGTMTLQDADHAVTSVSTNIGNVLDKLVINEAVVDVRSAKASLSLFSGGPTSGDTQQTYNTITLTNKDTTTKRYLSKFSAHPLQSCVINPDNSISTDVYIANTQNTPSAQVMIVPSIAGVPSYYSGLSAYYVHPSINSSMHSLNVSAAAPGALSQAYVYCPYEANVLRLLTENDSFINGALLDITALSSTPTEHLYTTNKTIVPGETSVFSITQPAIAEASTLDIYTYAPSTYSYKFTPYTNSVGTHILTDILNSINYEVLFSNKFMHNKHSAYKFGFTKNTELISLLNTNALHIPYTTGYIADIFEYQDIVDKGTAYSGEPTSVITVELPIFGSRYISIGSQVRDVPHNLTAYRDIYSCATEEVSSYFYENIRHLTYVRNNYQKHAWPDTSIDSAVKNVGMCFIRYPYFNNYNIDELYLNTHFVSTKWDLTPTSDAVGNTTAPVHCYLEQGAQTYVSGTMSNDAIQVDSRVIAKSNVSFNIVYDDTDLPVDSITRMGKYSLWTYTNEYGDNLVAYIPIVKIIDTTDSSVSVYALDRMYDHVLDITTKLETISSTNIQGTFLTRYKANSCTFEGFNALLNTYEGSQYTLNLGFIIYCPDVDKMCVFKGMSVDIDFSDTSLYTRPDWCYVNNSSNTLSATKSTLISDVSGNKVNVYNPNSTSVTDYAVRLDVTKYNLSTFINGVVAKLPSTANIPTLYEIDDDGHISSTYEDFNGKGLWVSVPFIAADSSIELTLSDSINSYASSDVFLLYEGFEIDNTVDFLYSKLYNDSFTANETDNGIGFESTSERVLHLGHTLSIGVYNHALQLTGQESSSVITNSTTLPSDTKYEIMYIADDVSSLEIAFGDIENIEYDAPLPYFNETADTTYTFVKTDMHKGDNYFYVYYDSITATDASTHEVFNSYQDFSDTDVPGWYVHHPEAVTITASNAAFTKAYTRIQSGNSISTNYSVGMVCRAAYSVVNSMYMCSVASSGTTLHGILPPPYLTGATQTSVRYMCDNVQAVNLGVSIPAATVSTYILDIHTDVAKIEQYSVQQHGGEYYINTNTLGTSMYAAKAASAHFNIGGAYSTGCGFEGVFAYESSSNVGYTCKFAALYKNTSSVTMDPVYNTQESGSWAIDGHTFIKRKIVKIHANSIDTQCVMILDRTQFLDDVNIRITSATHLEHFSNTNALSFTLGGRVQDIVGMDKGTTTQIPYWSFPSDADNMFIKTDVVKGTNTLYVYYTSDTATDICEGEDVFEFYEDFRTGELDHSKWHVVDYADGAGHRISPNTYQVLFTPDHLRSNYVLSDNYNVMVRGSIGTTINTSSATLAVWGNDVDYFGSYHAAGSGVDYFAPYYYFGSSVYSTPVRSAASPYVVRLSNHIFDADKKCTMGIEGSFGRVDASEGYVPQQYTYGYGNGNIRATFGRYYGNIRIGSSAHYPTAVNTAADATCNWVAAWKRSNVNYECIWDVQETGSWIVDGHLFTNRKKLSIIADTCSLGEVITIKQWQFGSINTIRITREERSGHKLRYIDTHRTNTILSFVPTDNDVQYARTLVDDEYNMSDSETNLAIKTPATGRLGITASTGSVDSKVLIKWIRSRKNYPLELVQLKVEDVHILIKNMNSDWYMFDTAVPTVKPANATNILAAISSNAIKNHDSVFFEKWVKFPSSNLVNTKHYGYGRQISYRN